MLLQLWILHLEDPATEGPARNAFATDALETEGPDTKLMLLYKTINNAESCNGYFQKKRSSAADIKHMLSATSATESHATDDPVINVAGTDIFATNASATQTVAADPAVNCYVVVKFFHVY